MAFNVQLDYNPQQDQFFAVHAGVESPIAKDSAAIIAQMQQVESLNQIMQRLDKMEDALQGISVGVANIS